MLTQLWWSINDCSLVFLTLCLSISSRVCRSCAKTLFHSIFHSKWLSVFICTFHVDMGLFFRFFSSFICSNRFPLGRFHIRYMVRYFCCFNIGSIAQNMYNIFLSFNPRLLCVVLCVLVHAACSISISLILPIFTHLIYWVLAMHGVCFPVNSVDRANEEKNPKIKKKYGEKRRATPNEYADLKSSLLIKLITLSDRQMN